MQKFIIDDSLPMELAMELRQHGHDAITLAESGLALPALAAGDYETVIERVECLLSYAKEHQRMVVTLNSEFHSLRRLVPKHPGIISFAPGTGIPEMVKLIETELPLRDSLEGRFALLRNPTQIRQQDLDLAARTGKIEKVRQILQNPHGLDLGSALRAAGGQGHAETVRCLIDHGADVNAADTDGTTALMTVCATIRLADAGRGWGSWDEYMNMVENLLAHGAKVNAQDADGKTPMHYLVIEYQNPWLEQRLVAAGADVGIADKDGDRPAYYRRAWSHLLPPPLYDIREILQASDADNAIGKLMKELDCSKTSANKWEIGLATLWTFGWNVYCDGLDAGLERLEEGKLSDLHQMLGEIGAIEPQHWLERVGAVIAPELPVNQYSQVIATMAVTEQHKAQLDELENEFYKLWEQVPQLAYDFMRTHEHLFGWRYGDRSRWMNPSAAAS